MRIINILPHPQHYTFAGTSAGGRILKPYESSPSLSFDNLLLPGLWKDIKAHRIIIALDRGDREFIQDVLREGAREVPKPVVKAPPKPVKKPVPVKKADKVSEPKTPVLATSTTAEGVCPVYKPLGKPLHSVEEVKAGVKEGKVSLRDLNRGGVPSTPTKKSTLKEIEGFMGGRI